MYSSNLISRPTNWQIQIALPPARAVTNRKADFDILATEAVAEISVSASSLWLQSL